MNSMTESANFVWHEGSDSESLAEHLAGEVAMQINNCIAERGIAVMAVSGGSTPKPFFTALAQHDVLWSKVVVTLVDERWVDETHELSNGAFLKANLLDKITAEQPTFIPLYSDANSVEESLNGVLDTYCKSTASEQAAPAQFDVVVLGMGGDGHTASFFPDASNIVDLLDPESNEYLLTCDSPSTQVPRITWSLPMLLNTPFLALHITGKNKADVFQQACANTNVTELPIRSAIFQNKTHLNVYYAD